MAHYYLDSSALAKQYIAEVGTGWVNRLLAAAAANIIYTALITGVEVVSALSVRMRLGTLTASHGQAALARFRADFLHRFNLVEVSGALVGDAMLLAERHGLRGYDAVQLAAALTAQQLRTSIGLVGITFVSADVRLNTVAAAEGLPVENPNTHP